MRQRKRRRMSAASPFAASFDDPGLSDVLLLVCNDIRTTKAKKRGKKGKGRSMQSASTPASTPTAVARSYHCHALVLSVLSGYFKAQLSSAWQQSTGPASGSERPVHIHVDAEELDALHELLRMMYSQTLPTPAPTGTLFLQCLKLADRFEAVSCMELLVGGLASAAIDCTLLKEVFEASPGVCVSRSYPALLESCSKALVRLFGDVPTVIRDEALLQQFCSLPHAAVLAWVKSDDLQVHSENCCVFLLSAWVKANKGSTAEQHEELAHQIRVFHLGPAYLHHILPNLGWFKDCSNMEYLPAVLSCIRAGIKKKGGLEAEKGNMHSNFKWPPGWCAKPRRSSNSSRTGSWVLNSSQLNEDGQQEMPSPVYVDGFMMKLELEAIDSAASAPGKTLGVFVNVDRPAMGARGVPWPSKAVLRMETIRVKLGSAGSEKSKEGVLLRSRLFAVLSPYLWGMSNFLGAAAPTVLELIAPYLQEGQLHIEVTFNAVDI